jgi:hypothetical protein
MLRKFYNEKLREVVVELTGREETENSPRSQSPGCEFLLLHIALWL